MTVLSPGPSTILSFCSGLARRILMRVSPCPAPLVYPYPAAAGLWTTSSDLALLVIDVMSALKKESKVGISANQVNEMITPQGCKEWTGLGVFLDGEEVSSLGWGVGFQCMLVAYPRLGSGLIIMTNTDQGVHQLEGIIGEVYHSHSFE